MPDWFKYIAGQDFESLVETPNLEQVVASVLKRAAAGDLLSLGHSMGSGHLEISEGEREGQMHIIGSPGEGKSKFLEYLIRKDIDRLIADKDKPKEERTGCGLCLIDPSAGGDTAYKVLRYAASKGFYKVLLIDAGTKYRKGKIASLNPFKCPSSHKARLLADMVEAFRIAFDTREPGKQAYIETYLPAILSVIHEFGGTLADTLYFISPPRVNLENEMRRNQIIEKAMDSPSANTRNHAFELDFAYKNIPNFRLEISSTVRRLNSLYRGEEDMRLLFGHRDGINYDRLISEGWIILVNVSDEKLDIMPSRLLAATIINRIISTKEKLWEHGYTKPFYLYVDEVSQFATRTLADLLDLKRKIGIRTVLAHQFLGQIEDRRVRQSIENNTKIKVAFYVSDSKERKDVMRLMGYPENSEIWEALSRQEKQSMVIRVNKNEPVIARVPDTPDTEWDLDAYLDEILVSNDVVKYHTPQEIQRDYDERYQLPPKDFKRASSSKAPDGKKSGKNSVPRRQPDDSLPKGDETAKKHGGRKPLKF